MSNSVDFSLTLLCTVSLRCLILLSTSLYLQTLPSAGFSTFSGLYFHDSSSPGLSIVSLFSAPKHSNLKPSSLLTPHTLPGANVSPLWDAKTWYPTGELFVNAAQTSKKKSITLHSSISLPNLLFFFSEDSCFGELCSHSPFHSSHKPGVTLDASLSITIPNESSVSPAGVSWFTSCPHAASSSSSLLLA